jgi:murein DD-endopeptidase / murein LD-carboxypeptidase
MMKVFYKTKGKFIVLLIAVCHLIITSCSRQLYPEPSFQNIKNPADKGKLNDFLAAGTEKEINTHNTSRDEIIETARKYLGVPHCIGGTTMKCIDCSGLLVVVFGEHGISLPHNSEEQARYGKILAGTNELKKGDLIFFIRSYNTNLFITHSGIYIGDNKFIHTSSNNGVTITLLNDPWWKERFIFGTRVIE